MSRCRSFLPDLMTVRAVMVRAAMEKKKALRILNDVSYVMRSNHEMHFAWQAQYLLRLEVDFAFSAHWK